MINQEWMKRIEEEFDAQTPEQIDKLLRQCKYYFEDDKMITGIISTVRMNKNISFNQWKALRAELSKHNNPTKTI